MIHFFDKRLFLSLDLSFLRTSTLLLLKIEIIKTLCIYRITIKQIHNECLPLNSIFLIFSSTTLSLEPWYLDKLNLLTSNSIFHDYSNSREANTVRE